MKHIIDSSFMMTANSLRVASLDTSMIAGDMHACPSCSKEFNNKQLLKRHLLVHSQSGLFPCDYCGEELEDKPSLRAHWRVCENNAGNFMCNTCGQLFECKDSLSKHQYLHDRAKRHRCSNCGKAFSFKSDLRKHMIIHTGIRPYVCPICSKTFTRSTNLNKHQRLHSGYRPFSCSQCPKSFSCKGDLARHEVIHSGLKPFSCSFCTLSFTRKDKLRKHERMHNRGTPLAFTCPTCPATFSRREELTKHSQFAHLTQGMDGLLVYVSELVKGSEVTHGAENQQVTPNLMSVKDKEAIRETTPCGSSLEEPEPLSLGLDQTSNPPHLTPFKPESLLQKDLNISPTLSNSSDIISNNNLGVR